MRSGYTFWNHTQKYNIDNPYTLNNPYALHLIYTCSPISAQFLDVAINCRLNQVLNVWRTQQYNDKNNVRVM